MSQAPRRVTRDPARRARRRAPAGETTRRLDEPPRRPTPPPGPHWQESVVIASGVNLLLGLWLIVAPFVLDYSGGDPYWNDIVFGGIVAVLALVRVAGAAGASWLSYLNGLIGAWLFISAFWLDDTSQAAWNDVIVGAVIFIFALVSATASDSRSPSA